MSPDWTPIRKVIITPDIREKIIKEHGIEPDFARDLVLRFFDYRQRHIPLEGGQGDRPIQGQRFIVEPQLDGVWYRVIFDCDDPPGHEIVLITCLPQGRPRFTEGVIDE